MQRVRDGWAFRSKVLLAVDDLHHANEPTVSLLSELTRRVRHQRTLLVTMTRPTSAVNASLGRDLEHAMSTGLDVIDLAPFDDSDVEELIRRRTGRSPSGVPSRSGCP